MILNLAELRAAKPLEGTSFRVKSGELIVQLLDWRLPEFPVNTP